MSLGFVLAILISGFFTGALARLAIPGPDPMPIWLTIAIGLTGSVVGGVAGKELSNGNGYVECSDGSSNTTGSCPAGTAISGATSPFTVRNVPKVPEWLAPSSVRNGSSLPFSATRQSFSTRTTSSSKRTPSASSTTRTPAIPRPSCSAVLQWGWKK